MSVEMQPDFPILPSSPDEVNKMIKEHSDLFSDSQCKVCSAVLISESQKLTHYQSKKHANKIRRYLCLQNEKEPAVKKLKTSVSSPDCNNGDADRYKACHLCNMTFSSPVIAESHYNGKVHAKKLRMKMGVSQTPAPAPEKAAPPKIKPAEEISVDNNNDPNRFCSICQAPFNNPLMAQQHYEGKKHRKRMTKMKLMETYGPSSAPASSQQGYQCTICNIELNSVEQYQSHVSGAKHKNQMKKLGKSPTENQQTAEKTLGSKDKFTSNVTQYAAEGDQYATGDNKYTSGEDEYTTGDQFTATDFQFGLGDMDRQYPGDNNQYMSEDKQYAEEYQYT
ncbi:zinc finger protein 346 [Cynoglossus semilaevis]|uniref:Zinc finger protein 346 n=1 Tax=Cynoglossus semilaevis TaxID=244447 RepID=A0A3P8WG32_CYNSE|nr:zinc finger protein 346-like [Cynoglossus semilaevis]